MFQWPGARLAEACQVLINHIIQTFELKVGGISKILTVDTYSQTWPSVPIYC